MCSTHGGNEIAGVIAAADLAGLLDIAERALRRVAHVPLTNAISDVELTQTVQRLQAVVRIAEARKWAVVAEIDQRHAARGQSAATTEDLLGRTLQLTPGEARTQTELAAGLALVPDTAKALADGRVGVSQAAVTIKKAVEVADRDDAAELLATIDQTASTAGQTLHLTRLAREIDTAVAKTGADVLAARERAALQRRKVEWDVREGMTILRAELPPAGGAIVKAALDALSRPSEGDTRSYPQRQADALVALAEQALKDPDGLRELGGVAAQVGALAGWAAGRDGAALRLGRGPALACGSGTLIHLRAATVAPPPATRRAPKRQRAGRPRDGRAARGPAEGAGVGASARATTVARAAPPPDTHGRGSAPAGRFPRARPLRRPATPTTSTTWDGKCGKNTAVTKPGHPRPHHPHHPIHCTLTTP